MPCAVRGGWGPLWLHMQYVYACCIVKCFNNTFRIHVRLSPDQKSSVLKCVRCGYCMYCCRLLCMHIIRVPVPFRLLTVFYTCILHNMRETWPDVCARSIHMRTDTGFYWPRTWRRRRRRRVTQMIGGLNRELMDSECIRSATVRDWPLHVHTRAPHYALSMGINALLCTVQIQRTTRRYGQTEPNAFSKHSTYKTSVVWSILASMIWRA